MKFLLERFYSLTAYTRLILLGSLLLAVVCLFLSALYGYLAAGEQYLRYLALSEGLLEASWSSAGSATGSRWTIWGICTGADAFPLPEPWWVLPWASSRSLI